VRAARIPHQRRVVKHLPLVLSHLSDNPRFVLIPQLLKVTYQPYQLLKVDAYVQRGIRSFGRCKKKG